MAIAGFALLAGISSATAATLPTGFEERTAVSGLTAPTAVAWAPGRAHVRGREGRQGAGRDRRRRAGLDAADRHLRPREHDRRPRTARASRSTRASRRTGTSTCSTHTTRTRRRRDQPKSSRLTRVTVNANNTASGGDRSCSAATRRSRARRRRTTWTAFPRTATRTRSGRCVRLPTARCGSAAGDGVELRRRRPEARAAHARRAEPRAASSIHVDRNGNGLPGHPFCPAVTDLTQVCTKVWAKGFRNPFRFTIRPNGLPAVGDVGWGSWEELNLAQPGRNYGWPCYEGRSTHGGYSQHLDLQGLLRQGGHGGRRHVPRPPLRPRLGASVIGGPTYTGGPYPDDFDGDIIFGDYVQGFIKRLELDAAGQADRHEGLRDRLVRRRHRAVERRALLRRTSATAAAARARSCASPTRPTTARRSRSRRPRRRSGRRR